MRIPIDQGSKSIEVLSVSPMDQKIAKNIKYAYVSTCTQWLVEKVIEFAMTLLVLQQFNFSPWQYIYKIAMWIDQHHHYSGLLPLQLSTYISDISNENVYS